MNILFFLTLGLVCWFCGFKGVGFGVNVFASLKRRVMRKLFDLLWPFSFLQLMVNLSRTVRGHFVMIIEVSIHQTECNPGHVSTFALQVVFPKRTFSLQRCLDDVTCYQI